MNFLFMILPYIAPAIRYADNPNRQLWRLDLLVFALFVWIVDMIVAALFFSPKRGEWTVSHTLERTAITSEKHRALALAINQISPNHIKAVT